ncbi:diaminopropionate ammonia-lyase [Bacillus atrophaeus]|uniref:diaminopropionate ammonia-lyase n=1 Tax=Bacillus atrophaeus TaxID=1452 RepID=UPI002281671B|nr:diaminopropionate ammonia-lyase [Bacillus atrophaeus]MCY8490942.1 diaminopropionate ammonia-lyase [Bacillus atrophaeus]MCY8817822.1 diaminopropionate ammonia-lyase [Bacillus atrophaeus]
MNTTRFFLNPSNKFDADKTYTNYMKSEEVLKFHRKIHGYKPSPLLKLSNIGSLLDMSHLYVKDESGRYGIQSFKGLGASYSIYCIIKKMWREKFNTSFKIRDLWSPYLNLLGPITLTAATDGNHGKAVSWFTRLIKQQAIIYMPKESATSRIKSIEEEGAKVVLVNGTYDKCVRQCKKDAELNGRQVVSDTAYPGNMEQPFDIIVGYTTLFKELDEQCQELFDYVIVPAGVGGIAAAAALYFNYYKKSSTKIIVIEPLSSACIMESLIAGTPSFSKGRLDSIMAGLNCGFPSLLSWELLKNTVYFSVAIPDEYVIQAIKYYYDEGIISGESGASALAGLLAIIDHQDIARKLNILNSSVLLLNTEGNTNPAFYSSIIR